MIDRLMTDKELDIVIELLEAEHKRLLPEIHHTDTAAFRHQLVERARTMERLMERFRERRAEEVHPAGQV